MSFRVFAFLAAFGVLAPSLWGQATAPTVASLSNSQTVTEGQSVTLSVSVNGTAPFTYQWRKDGSPMVGATGSTHALNPIRESDAGTYTVVITNSAGSTTSGPVVIAVNRAVAPAFYSQPQNRTVVVGDTIEFYASVNGTNPLTFTWKKGTTTLATTSSSYYSKAGATSADAGSYTVTVSNIAGSVTSNPFTVTVNAVTPPTISTLYDQTVSPGDSIYFWPSVSGSGTITYQWKKDGVNIAGANSAYFSKYNMTAADAGTYTLTATNSAGSTTSNGAKVTLRPAAAPTISSVSGPVSVTVGDSFSISVYANGTDPLTFQWKKDGVAITGATSSYYSKSNVQISDAGSYQAVVTNAQGSATSNAVPVTVTNARPPLITYHPASFAVREGEYLSSLYVSVAGTGPFTYQWSKDGTAIAGATGSSHSFSGRAAAAHAGSYTVMVSSGQGSATSEPCRISILPATAPVIGVQPATMTVRQGEGVSLYASVTGTPTPTYQWRKDGVNIAGATYANFEKSNLASSDAGAYSFVATNAAGSVTSDAATITVLPAQLPKITQHPASASLLPGDSFHGMYVQVESTSNATVKWYRNGDLIPGATSSYIYIYDAQPSVAGTYTAVVTNAAGSVTSREGVITVDANTTRPVITYVPGSRALFGGESAWLSISTSGSGESVQWYKDGAIILNASAKEYSFSGFGAGSAGTYTAQVTTTLGTFTSRPIVLELRDAGAAPLITRQPASRRTSAGSSFELNVYVQGEAPITYQWRKDGVNIPGATSSYYYTYNVTASDAGGYSVAVTNRNGTATSAAATVSIATSASAAPIITQHPASQTISSSYSSARLEVYLLDSTGATYQWRKDGVAITGATSYSHYVPSGSGGRYSVVVTNPLGSVTSYDAVVAFTTAATGPVFTTQPQNVEGFFGTTVTLSATATGAAPITYQWRKNGVAITGATSSTLTLANVQGTDAATYTVIATDANGSTPSTPVTLTLSGGTAPFIVSQPANVTAMVGTVAAFTATVGGSPAPTVQWQRNGAKLAGATNLALNLSSVTANDAGTYTLVARNAIGTATSSAATLTVVFPPPVITTQPSGANVPVGGSATFSVVATANPDPTYQWRRNGLPIAGATTGTLTLTNIQSDQAGRYSVVVTTSYGSVTSVEALLTVGSPVTASMPRSVTASAGTAVTLSAAIVSNDPLRFRWARNGVPIAGATNSSYTIAAVQPADAGIYSLEIARPDGTVIYPLTGSAALTTTLVVEVRSVAVITQHPIGGTVPIGGSFTLSVTATGDSFSYQWQKNGVPIPDQFGPTLVLRNVQAADAGEYRVVLLTASGPVYSNPARVEVAGSPFAGTYLGTFGTGDHWALQVGPDGSAVFIALLSNRGQAIVARGFSVDTNGVFTFGRPVSAAASDQAGFAARYFDGIVQGRINGSGVTGQVAAANLPFGGDRVSTTGSGFAATHFEAVPFASDMGRINVITAPDGSVVLVAVDATGVRGGRGRAETNGTFAVTTTQYAFTGTLAPAAGQIRGTYSPAGGTTVTFGTAAAPDAIERLANVATRGLTAAGARMLTAGFVIGGNEPKEVLIRAVGPGLETFGVSGVLANPKLRVFRGSTAVLENDDWALGGFANQIADAARRVGAFTLPAGSADAAVLARLDPGAYTAQVFPDGEATGVALVEVYDTTTPAAGTAKLINLSTRGEVGRDGDILIVGVVVSGTSAKRLLIRGIGPTLTDFGVSGALADPRLQLFQGSTLLRENDNWSDALDAAQLTAVASGVGAFALPVFSKDSALLVYLPPGNYTAQVRGSDGGTGVALVEVYEVP